ncbi:MAG: NifU family protein, partial [Bacteroidota bacterium]
VPNPLAMKFEVSDLLLTPGAYEFDSPEAAKASPLALKLFGFDYVTRVFIAKNFVTVSKEMEEPTWDELMVDVRIVIKKHLEAREPLFTFDGSKAPEYPALGDPTKEAIRDAIEHQINRATWQDGGEINYVSFEDGVVKVKMAGACIDCPFAPRTIKHGVEVFLKQQFPEVKEVTTADVNWEETQA